MLQDRIHLFEIQIPVDVDEHVPESRQVCEISCQGFMDDPLISEDLKCLPVGERLPQSPLCDHIGRHVDRRLDG